MRFPVHSPYFYGRGLKPSLDDEFLSAGERLWNQLKLAETSRLVECVKQPSINL